jgi:hypothetical protein
LIEIGDIQRNPVNPNKHSPEQIQRLATVIERNGWRNPLVVSKRSGYLVKGEGRLLAAFQLGLKEVPVEYQDYSTDDEEYSDLIADNKVAEMSEQDKEELKVIISKMDTDNYSGTGFSQTEIDDLLSIMDTSISNTPVNQEVPTYQSSSPISYVQELMNEEIGDRTNTLDLYFSVSFCFDNKYIALKEYIRENGKEELEKVILEKAGVI